MHLLDAVDRKKIIGFCLTGCSRSPCSFIDTHLFIHANRGWKHTRDCKGGKIEG